MWRRLRPRFAGQTWLVIGGSEGIGGSAARSAVAAGARVICVARDAAKLAAFAQSTGHPERVQSLDNLAAVCRATGRRAEAAAFEQRAAAARAAAR